MTNLNPEKDQKILLTRAFGVQRKCADLLKQIHALLASGAYKDFHLWLFIIKEWLLVPYTEWAIDFEGFGRHLCAELVAGKKPDPDFAFLIHLVKDLPNEEAQEAVGDYEHTVNLGYYGNLVNENVKYDVRERELLDDLEFHSDVKRLDDMFGLAKLANPKGILRRVPNGERNFRHPDFYFSLKTKRTKFETFFLAFSAKWELYGLEITSTGEIKPLLMKVTVNLTRHGLSIVFPRWMSFDVKRDLKLKAISALTKARCEIPRQGPKASENRLEMHEQAKKAFLIDVETKHKLRGKARWDYIKNKLRLHPDFQNRRIYEMIQLGESLLEGVTTPETTDKPETTSGTSARFKAMAIEAPLLSPEEKRRMIEILSA